MNEVVLNALLQLFAIIANVSRDGVSFKARKIVKAYLSQHLNEKLATKYMKIFDQYLEVHHPEVFDKHYKTPEQKPTPHSKVVQIGEEINRNLLGREKFIVFLRLVEFINEDDVMTKTELDFIKATAETFNIKPSSHDNTRIFVKDSLSPKIEKEKLLIIDDRTEPRVKGAKHIYRPDLKGCFSVLRYETSDTFVLRYKGKSNLYLNGQYLHPGRIEVMEQGSILTGKNIAPIYFSDISRAFHHPGSEPRIQFHAENIEFKFKNSNKGIQRFSFSKESGNLVGIMGGSGVGKSTLLGILSGKIPLQQGRITINGFDIHKDHHKIEGLVGYVPQDDLLIEELTVFQNLYFNAQLCLQNLAKTEILRRVNQIMIDLELDDIKDLKVGSPVKKLISGGQRKRLNIALELIREPGILFVDEPTSGLSSMDSEKVMYLLKEQALKARLVVANIHQPSSDIFKLFDRILILDKGGYTIYKGNPIDALVYFKSLSNYVDAEVGQCVSCGNVNPEEILQIVESREVDEFGRVTTDRRISPEEWYETYIDKIESKEYIRRSRGILPKIDFKIPNAFTQFRIFSTRNVLSKLANHQYMLVNFLEAPLLAVIIGYFTKFIDEKSPVGYTLFENMNLPAYLFMSIVVALFMGLMVSAEEIISDRKIQIRESFLHLSRLSYLHSKIFVLFGISAIQTLSFVLVGNAILEIKGMTLTYWLLLFTTSCLANMIGLNLSAGLNSVVTIYIIIPFFLVPQLLFSGVIVKFDQLHNLFRHPVYTPVIGDMMTSRWAYEALAVHQFKDNLYYRHFFDYDQQRQNASYNRELVQRLESLLYKSYLEIQRDSENEQTVQNLKLIENELNQIVFQENLDPVDYLDQINLTGVTAMEEDLFEATRSYLGRLQLYFQNKELEALALRDSVYEALVRKYGSKERLVELKNDYTNERLEHIVTNKDQVPYMYQYNTRMIRKKDPIFMKPTSSFGRAHFYAPEKRLGHHSFDTFWFNLVLIWISTFSFYMTLVFDVLRKLVDRVENIRLRKQTNGP
jgi:ABC-type multidrug transport system ATPase subunit